MVPAQEEEDEGEEVMLFALKPAAKFALKAAPKFQTGIRNTGIGAGIGATGSFLDNLGEDEFEAGEFAKETALGGLMGLTGFGLGGKIAGKSAALGRGLQAATGLGALMGPDMLRIGPGGAKGQPGTVGGPLGPPMPQGGSGSLSAGSSLGMFGGLGAPPSAPAMTIADYMEQARLQGIADAQINSEVIPLKAKIAQINRYKNADLHNNEVLGEDIKTQMDDIARDNRSDTQAIQNNAEAVQLRAEEEADAAINAAGALGIGNDATNAETAGENAELQARLADRRMQDSELLQRLGVSGQEILAELSAAEQMQTGQNAIKIRTDANDAVTETRGSIDAVRSKRPGILYQLASGEFDAAIQKHQAATNTWQGKLAAATAKADASRQDLEAQASMSQAAGSGMPEYSDLNKDSGMIVAHPVTGDPMHVPFFATLPWEAVAQTGMIPQETWMKWQQMIQAEVEGQ